MDLFPKIDYTSEIMKLKVGVIFGGNSVEHEISIISALQAMESMDEEKYEIIPIYIAKNREWYTGPALRSMNAYKDSNELLRRVKNIVLYAKDGGFVLQNKKGFKSVVAEIDVAFPIVHGTNVEDGTLQGYLDSIGIPYAGSNVLASANSQDKVVMKQIFAANNLPIVNYVWFFDTEYADNENDILKQIDNLGYPVIVKPANLGSSIGINKAKNRKDVTEAIETALAYDTKIIVESVVDNLIEVNCSVIGNYESQSTSEIEEVMGNDEILSYNDKYIGDAKGTKSKSTKGMVATNRIIPARISKDLTDSIKKTSKETFKVLNSSGVVRIDYLIDKKEQLFYINEINAIPGSLAFYLWKDRTYQELLDEVINIAIRNYKIKSKKIYSFDTNVLQNFNGSKGAKGKLKI